MSHAFLRRWWILGICLLPWPAAVALACPFCSAVSMTLSEEIKVNDASIIAKLVKRPAAVVSKGGDAAKQAFEAADAAPCTFEIVEVLKGKEHLGDARQIETLYFGDQPVGTSFLIFGADPNNLAWATPTPLTDRSVKYVSQLVKLPESGRDRLAFFQEYLEDSDSLLAADAYDEFARAPYAEVVDLKDRMDQKQLVKWIQDPEMTASRRRLYLTMLGVCGGPQDVAVLEEMIKTEDRQVRTALDAMIACYLNLKGPQGMGLIEDLFLKNADAEYTDTYSAIMALRFHGQETKVIPRQRLMEGLRHMLDRPQLADLVIPDLARWEDWSVMDRLVKLFKDADEDSAWVRVPVINYLRACPLPEAQEHIAALSKVDPDAVKRASQFFPLGVPGTQPAANLADKTTDPQKAEGNSAATASATPSTTDPLPAKQAGVAEDKDQPAKQQPDKAQPDKIQPGKTEPETTKPDDTKPVVAANPPESTGQNTPADRREPSESTSVATATPPKVTTEKTPAADPAATGGASPAAADQPKLKASWVLLLSVGAALGVLVLLLVILRGNRKGAAV